MRCGIVSGESFWGKYLFCFCYANYHITATNRTNDNFLSLCMFTSYHLRIFPSRKYFQNQVILSFIRKTHFQFLCCKQTRLLKRRDTHKEKEGRKGDIHGVFSGHLVVGSLKFYVNTSCESSFRNLFLFVLFVYFAVIS